MTDRGSQDGSPFDPVLLDLTDTEDYATVVHALEAYASDQDWEAEEEKERIRSNNLPDSESDEEHYLRNAARARRIAADIERQLDANSAARQALDGKDSDRK